MTKIDHKIPFPDGSSKYPFHKLNVGDSFLFPDELVITSAGSIAKYWSLKLRTKFKCRTTDEGVRCWRVE